MSRREIEDTVRRATKLKKNESEKVINTIFDTIVNTLKSGESVQLIGFGTFSVRERESGEEEGKTGKQNSTVFKCPVFTPGKTLKDTIKGKK